MPDGCSIAVEDRFGPIVHGCKDNVDFTLLFEETILYIGPLCLALLIATFRMPHLYRAEPVASRGMLMSLKSAVYSSLVVVNIVIVAIETTNQTEKTRATIAAFSLGIVGSAFLFVFSLFEHCRSPRPSSILTLYFLLSLPLNAVRARTIWNLQRNNATAIIFIIFTILAALVLVLETYPKRHLLLPTARVFAPEETSGIIARSFAIWFAPLFITGLGKRLQLKDLFPIDKILLTDYIKQGIWKAKGSNNESASLLGEIIKTHRTQLFEPAIPRACYIALTFAQAFLVHRATQYIDQPVGANTYVYGGLLVVAYFLVYVGLAVTNLQYQQLSSRSSATVRAGLVSQIFRHSLRLGAGTSSVGASTTLISADVDRVQLGFRRLHDTWANFVTAAIGLWLIYVQLGVSMAVSLAFIIVCICVNFALSTFITKAQRIWLEATQNRVALTAQVLKSMKGIKMTGCRPVVQNMLAKARQTEIRRSFKFRAFLIVTVSLAYASLTVSPALGIGISATLALDNASGLLSASTVFTSLTLYTIVSAAMTEGLSFSFQIISAIGCVHRIQAFLTDNLRVDSRLFVDMLQSNVFAGNQPTHVKETDEETISDGKDRRSLAFRLTNFFARWTVDSEWTLKDLQLEVPLDGITVISGPTGSGKSTLLKAMLGEVRSTAGSLCIKSDICRIGYCDQTPWLTNASIKSNVIGAEAIDEMRYRAALCAVSLERDLSELADGDASVCGSNGLNLSGGQKARIALARAVYANTPVAILDDCFSGLDGVTESRVLFHLFGPNGVFKSRSTTVILATSSTKHLTWADHAVILNKSGRIEYQGTYESFSQLTDSIVSADSLPGEARVTNDSEKHDAAAEVPRSDEPKRAVASSTSETSTSSELEVYKTFFGACGWLNMAVFASLCAVFVFGAIYPQIYLKSWVQQDAKAQNASLDTLLGIYLGIGSLAWVAFACACTYFMFRIAAIVSTRFHMLLLTTTLGASVSFFATTDNGTTINRFSQDLQMVDQDVPMALIGVTIALLQLVGQCIVIIIGSNYSGIAIPVLIIVVVMIERVYVRTSKQLRLLDLETRAPLFTQFLESLGGLSTLRAFDWTSEQIKRGIAAMERSQPPFYLLYTAQNTLTLVLELVNAALAVTVVSIAVGSRTSNSGGLGLALFNIVGLGQSIKALVNTWTTLEISLGAVARVRDFTLHTASEDDGTNNTGKESRFEPANSWPDAGHIQFKGIDVAYSEELPPVISDLVLDISPGTKIGICGRTGSGKSTLIGSLLRLVDLRAGCIMVDGLNIANIDRDSVRSRLTVVPQEPFTFQLSLRDNMNIHGHQRDEDIISVLQKSGLWDLFDEKSGLDTVLTEDILSHGHRQLLSFALAMLRQSSILVLDEPTSQVDIEIQEHIQRTVMHEFAGRTVLCIAHRLETILDFDLVAVMDAGKIVELGQPRELLTRPENTAFRRLYRDSHRQPIANST